MVYTVKQLAKASGVSVRTLHWYDEIGLLEPAHIGDNNYRYYEKEQLLRLQQILFFKELGFKLDAIQKLLMQNNFDMLLALYKHKRILNDDICRKNQLIETVEKTILHLKGKLKMTNEELYKGFDLSRQKEYEQYLVEYHGTEAENLLFESKKRTTKWGTEQWDDIKSRGDAIHKALAKEIDAGSQPESDRVQTIIQQHFEITNEFYKVTKDVYIGLTSLYADHPDFKKFFDVYHPKMIEFLGEAMRFYANKNL